MKQAKTLTAAELRRVTDSIATRAHATRSRAMLMMTHLAGLRVGEVAQLTWTDVINAEGRVGEEVRLNPSRVVTTSLCYRSEFPSLRTPMSRSRASSTTE
jgi:integrase/recombinase XerD